MYSMMTFFAVSPKGTMRSLEPLPIVRRNPASITISSRRTRISSLSAKAGGVEKLEHRRVAEAVGGGPIGGGQERFDVGGLNRLREVRPQLRILEILRGVFGEVSLGDEKAEQAANRRQCPGHRSGRDPRPTKRSKVLDDMDPLDLLGGDSLIGQPVTEVPQVGGIRGQRVPPPAPSPPPGSRGRSGGR